MRYTFAALLGFIVGVGLAAALVYYNPFIEESAPPPDTADRALHYALPEQVLGFTVGERAWLPGEPAEEDAFWEETIANTALLGLVLNDTADVPRAVASRLLAASAETDLLLRGALVSDYWLLTIPGEGTLFVRVDHNVWPFVKETLLPKWYLERPWSGPVDYRPAAGPGPQSTALIVGATGAFVGLEGSAVEDYRVTDLDRASGLVRLSGTLHLHLLEPTLAAEQ
jgi:hypothetical protein